MSYRLANVAGRAALVEGSDYFDAETVSGGKLSSDPMAILEQLDEVARVAGDLSGKAASGTIAGAALEAPVPRPRNCFGIGLNYKNHAAEANMELPEKPVVFTKFPSCIVGPTADVRMRSDGVDYEGELVVVIGRGGADIAEADAWKHVAGLTVGQDISDRPAQFMAKPPHFDMGKSFDTFGPIGPVLVSPDAVSDKSDLGLKTLVNDEVVQDDRTSNLIFDVPTLVSFLSRITTLVAGDMIFTGTPEGVGVVKGVFLKDGDVITTTIDDIGTITNKCVRVSDWS